MDILIMDRYARKSVHHFKIGLNSCSICEKWTSVKVLLMEMNRSGFLNMI